jgi:hypothetical protein
VCEGTISDETSSVLAKAITLINRPQERMQQFRESFSKYKTKAQRERDRNRINADRRKLKAKSTPVRTTPAKPKNFDDLVKQVVSTAQGSPSKMKFLQEKLGQVAQSKAEVTLLHLRSLKEQNRVAEHAAYVQKLRQRHGSITAAANFFGVPRKSFRLLCLPQKEKQVKPDTDQVKHAKEFWKNPLIASTDPSARYGGKLFLSHSVAECYKLYVSECAKRGLTAVKKTKWNRLRPKNVYTLKNTPENRCICKDCANLKLVRQALRMQGVVGIPVHRSDELRASMCPCVADADP